VAISVWPLESDSNVIHADLFYSFLDQVYGNEGVLENDDLTVVEDIQGIGVKVSPGGAVVQYDSAPGGKRIFYNSAESKSGPGKFYNPNFDTDPATTGWVGYGGATIARSTAVFHSPPASCQVVTNGAATYNRGIQLSGINTRADPNRDTELSCWATIPAGIGIKLSVTEHDVNYAQIGGHEDVKVGTGDWLKFTCKFKTLANTRYLWCQVLVSHTSTVTFYVDTFDMTHNFEWEQPFRSPHPGLPRVDRVVVKIRDKNVTGGGDTSIDGKFSVIPGFPTAGATLSNLSGAAAVPANSYLLANVLVPAGATALSAANIDNAVRTPTELAVPASVLSSISALDARLDSVEASITALKTAYPKELLFTIAQPIEAFVANIPLYGTLTYFFVPRALTVTSIGLDIQVAAGGADIDVGIYTYDAPNTEYDRVWSSGPELVSVDGEKNINITSGTPTTLVLQPGIYWLALVADIDITFKGRNEAEFRMSWDTLPTVWPLPAVIDESNLEEANRAVYAIIRGV
jgi:hypothetical protein